MQIDGTQGLLINTTYYPSPNCDERPKNLGIDLVVIHGISVPANEFGGPGIIELFTNTLDPLVYGELADHRVSSHVLIRRDGEILQFVPFRQRAWHAGESCFQGRSACNDFSIGIELEGTDLIPYTNQQYEQCTQLLQALLRTYPAITAERIVGHAEIAPGRKTDPGPVFDWSRLRVAP